MVRVIMFNATFNNILAISMRSVLLVEKTGVRGKKHWPVESHRQTLSHNVVSSGTHDYICYYYYDNDNNNNNYYYYYNNNNNNYYYY
jgi:hypothetical protein